MSSISKNIDHTVLKQDATTADIKILCGEAIELETFSVCVNPTHVKLATELLKDSDVLVCTVVGFPLGANIPEVKAFETEKAIADGADEIDMVINIGALKSKDYDLVKKDILTVLEVTKKHNKLLKVIVETCLLTKDELIKICEIFSETDSEYIKTSTGFSTSGAQIDDVKLMFSTIKQKRNDFKIKASGGIKTTAKALDFLNAGASRLGTSSAREILKNI